MHYLNYLDSVSRVTVRREPLVLHEEPVTRGTAEHHQQENHCQGPFARKIVQERMSLFTEAKTKKMAEKSFISGVESQFFWEEDWKRILFRNRERENRKNVWLAAAVRKESAGKK